MQKFLVFSWGRGGGSCEFCCYQMGGHVDIEREV